MRLHKPTLEDVLNFKALTVKNVIFVAGASVLIGLISYVAWFSYDNYRHNRDIKKLGGVKPTTQIATAGQEEKRYEKVDDQNLKKGDLESYQVAKLALVNNYLLQKDYKSAERLLTDIRKNISEDKLQKSYYIYKLEVDQNSGDVNAQKADLGFMISISRLHQQNQEADGYQRKLSNLNGSKSSTSAPSSAAQAPIGL